MPTLLLATAGDPAQAEAFFRITLLDMIGLIILIGFLVGFFLVIRKVVLAAGQMQKESEEAEKAFLAEATRQAALADTTDGKLGENEASSPSPAGPSSNVEASESSPPAASPPPEKSDDPLEKLVKQLKGLQIVTEYEGRIALPLPPEGQIYRLRRGGVAGVLPRLEGPELMEHFCRRFDLVFFPLPGGEAGVMERFQSRVPALTDDLSQMPPRG